MIHKLPLSALLPLILLAATPVRPQSSNQSPARTIEADSLPGADLGAKLRAADAALGTSPGTIRVSSPAKVSTATTLAPNHGLLIAAPVSWTATVTLAGNNDISCTHGGSISATLPRDAGIFTADGAANLNIHDCAITFAGNNTVLFAQSLHNLTVAHLSVTGGRIADVGIHPNDRNGGSTGLTFTGNAVHDPPDTGGAGILIVNTIGATITGNTFDGISTGTQWWGGDSAHGNLQQVTHTGKLILTNNRCHTVTACLWGSMGYGISVTHNQADGCADVCFDTEGGTDTTFDNNVATNCGNGCGAIFFYSRNITFRNNDFSGDARGGGLIFIKNASADPRAHTAFTVSGNKLTCATTCRAFFQEAVSGATFDTNTISNGTFTTAGFGQNITVSRNQFTFTRAIAGSPAAILAPSITGGTALTIEGNVVTSNAAQPANSACISAVWNDFNNSDTYNIRRNRCAGSSPFPIDIVTDTAGANPGPHADWHIEDNVLGAGKLVHLKTTSNETYAARNNCPPTGCSGR